MTLGQTHARQGKRSSLIVHDEEPLNAESPRDALAERAITATDAFYVRGHGPIPVVGTTNWRLPEHGALVPAGLVEVRGYAFAGGERQVARVDASADGGATWQEAELLDDLGRWAWRMWRAELELASGLREIVVRAWDDAAATQPEDPATVWNPKGYVNNSWGRVTVKVVP